jgi:hypothetical protein
MPCLALALLRDRLVAGVWWAVVGGCWMIPCTLLGFAPCFAGRIPLPEVDEFRLDDRPIKAGRTEQDILNAIGPPPFVDGPDILRIVRWWYPIRDVRNTDSDVLAPWLSIAFDGGGIVKHWRFVHPVTRATLPIRGTAQEVERQFARACVRRVATIVLASSIVPGVSTKADVEKALLSFWGSDRVPKPWRSPKKSTGPEGEVRMYPVDRPSPVYIPSFVFEVAFKDGVVVWAVRQGYGGCK